MARFHSVKLELLRPGPSHNQLLSRLTPYLALCGDGSPITFRIDLDHRDLLNRLERLRYLTVQNQVREATVGELGEEVADILSKIPTLLAEVSRAQCEDDRAAENEPQYLHLNLILGGTELSLIPFELAFAPQSFPGEGVEFCLQLDLPVVPTRETRRSRGVLRAWNSIKDPKLLVVVADPQNFGVPIVEHIAALRAAMEPWIEWPRRGKQNVTPITERDRLPFVKQRISVLSNASLDEIRKKCSEEKFTHVHILAHGGEYEVAGEKQYGLVLCADGNPAEKTVVDGKRLAKALQALSSDGVNRSSPLVVSLATCDSGNPGSVLLPGGSLAHDLHLAGIPWVFASQFPLTKAGSIRMLEGLYPGLLRGDDPRQVLYEVRRRLYMGNQRDHDWASLVVYASIPRDFDEQVVNFFENRSLSAIETALARADDLVDVEVDAAGDELEKKLDEVKSILDAWRLRLPGKDRRQPTDCARRAHCYGMHGSVYKRIALLRYSQARRRQDEQIKRTAEETLKQSLGYYRKASEEELSSLEKFHWVATQALSLSAALHQPSDDGTLELARQVATRNLQHASVSEQAWAHATLAELEMIRANHRAETEKRDVSSDEIQSVADHCRKIVELMGRDSFHVESTRRQFQRYVDYWPDRPWNAIAKAAIEQLSSK